MPDPNIDWLNAITKSDIYPSLVEDVIFMSTPFLAYVRNNATPHSGGTDIRIPIMYKPLVGGSYVKGDTFSLTKPDTLTALQFALKTYFVNITEYLEDVEITNRGPNAVFSLVDLDLKNAMNTLNAILAIDMSKHGQAADAGYVTGARTSKINGWTEALNDGVTNQFDGNRYRFYGGLQRGGAVGSKINSYPKWFGTSGGATAVPTYAKWEEMYQEASRGALRPNLFVANKGAISQIKVDMQGQQQFMQEEDPVYGVKSFRFENASVLQDDYFPSARYGVNDPDLGDFRTGTFTSATSGIDARSGLPANTAITVGEVAAFFNTDVWELRVSDSELFGFGFTGFKPAQDNTRVAGQILGALNLLCHDPALNKVGYGIA